ncbi:MAG: Cof-type HAD-IIB family hydrolase [Terrisporobacter sp.]|uniref:Cof-type HAD-IIB family hydrolase n=1 Tax=Terrisporobacter sp. TaxID=1965305 RepID=UPI002FCACF97
MKYLASDLDGTLIHNGEIRKEDIDAIVKLKDRGYKFIISTGRGIKSIEEVFSKHPEVKYDYIVGCNGSIVLDKNRNIVHEAYISNEIGGDLLKDFIDEDKCCTHFESENENYLVDPVNTEDVSEFMNHFKEVISKEDTLNGNRKYSMISLFARDKCVKRAQLVRDKIADKYGDKLEAFRNQYFIDIAPKGCSKGAGINKVLELDGGNVDNLYTIGDSLNDISMFKITKNSFTFNNAEESVKVEANNYVDTVEECIDRILA